MNFSVAINVCRLPVRLIYPTPIVVNKIRYYSKDVDNRKSIYKRKEAKKIRFYILQKYMDYIKNYDKHLEKHFPAAMKVYRGFVDGVKSFISDTKDYFKITKLLNKNNYDFTKLLRREMELYDQLPKDMLKVAPVLLIFTLPLGYIILPVAYTFPRQLLCSHFWNERQRAKFLLLDLRDRLVHNRPVFRYLQSQMGFLQSHCLYHQWGKIIGQLGSGLQPSVKEIILCKELFNDEPYHLFYLSHGHVRHLLKMHGLHMGWFRRSRLYDRANILKEMDLAIKREGGVHNLPTAALKKSCYIRGLNPANLQDEQMIKYLENWINLSNQIDNECYSLLLHAPVLLAYNAPSNWRLIYKEKKKI